MFDVNLAFPLGAGLVAAFNPCGFAMLPAYLSYFLGLESESQSSCPKNILRGLTVGFTLTAGFMFLFGVVGVLTNTVVSESAVESRIGYVTLAAGVLMIPLGIAMTLGVEPKLRIPFIKRGASSSDLPAIFVFGASYAAVSISCTAPIFFGSVISSFSRDGFVDGMAVFITYATGMSLVILVLTLGIAMARTSVVSNMRRVLPYVNKVSGGLLVVAGSYLTWYGIWEIRIARDPNVGSNSLVDLSNDANARINIWINDVGSGKFAMATLMIVIGTVTWALTSNLSCRRNQLGLRSGFVAVYLLAEILQYKGGLLILPALTSIIDIPERVGNWFTDPYRWPALFEVVGYGLTSVSIGFLLAHNFKKKSAIRREGLKHQDLSTVPDSQETATTN